MPCTAKELSVTDGRKFLKLAFTNEQAVLSSKLEFAEKSITHDGKRGDVAEQHILETLRRYLPRRYSADSAIVIDSHGCTSEQQDVVIYDPQFSPILLDQQDHKYVPAEAVYAVFEVKPTIHKEYLEYAGKKAASVRSLFRTSDPIPHAGGVYPPKPLIPITAGIIATRVDWSEGFGAAFRTNHQALAGDFRLDAGVALHAGAFDVYAGPNDYTFADKDTALVFFIFRLLQRLQSVGTVGAINWNAYAAELSKPLP